MIETIINKLKANSDNRAVFFGAIPPTLKLDRYDYAVVQRDETAFPTGTRTERYLIVIAREEIIPSKYIENTVIPALKSIGLKFDRDSKIKYTYAYKPETATAIEAAGFYVTKSESWCV